MTHSPGLLILAVVAAGLLFVLLPVMLTTFYEYRRKRTVVCPETGRPAEIGVDAGKAMRGAAFGLRTLKVEDCSRWPDREGCEEGCLRTTQPAEIQA
jgi:hypothetical protein